MKTEEKLNTFSHTHTYIHSKDIISSRQRVEVIHSFTHAPAFTHQLFHLIMFLLNFSGSLKKKKRRKNSRQRKEKIMETNEEVKISENTRSQNHSAQVFTQTAERKRKKKQQSHAHTHKRVSGREKSAHFFFAFFF